MKRDWVPGRNRPRCRSKREPARSLSGRDRKCTRGAASGRVASPPRVATATLQSRGGQLDADSQRPDRRGPFRTQRRLVGYRRPDLGRRVWRQGQRAVHVGGEVFPVGRSVVAAGGKLASRSAHLPHGDTTGTEMVVWGGRDPTTDAMLANGARYDPSQSLWTPMSSIGAPSARRYQSAIWTGSEVIVWGGDGGPDLVGDGARYDPSRNGGRRCRQRARRRAGTGTPPFGPAARCSSGAAGMRRGARRRPRAVR